MKLNFQINKTISQKYFTYIILKSFNNEGVLDLTTLQKKYGISECFNENDYETINKFKPLIIKIKEDFKGKSIMANFSESIANKPSKNWSKLEEELSDIFSEIFRNEEKAIQKQKDFLEKSRNLGLLSSMEKIFNTNLEEVNVYLTPGGLPKFSPGLAMNLKLSKNNNLNPTIFIASSNTLQEGYPLLESTVIHEILHLVENNSECSLVAKKYVMSSYILKHKPQGVNTRHFIFESIITAVAGNKYSYHIQKYHSDYYSPYSWPDNANTNDLYRKVAASILPIITPYIEKEMILDGKFFEKITGADFINDLGKPQIPQLPF